MINVDDLRVVPDPWLLNVVAVKKTKTKKILLKEKNWCRTEELSNALKAFAMLTNRVKLCVATTEEMSAVVFPHNNLSQ